MNWLSVFTKYLALVTVGVLRVEEAVGSSVPGTTKASIVLGAIQAAADVESQIPDETAQKVGKLTSGIVGALNASGFFQHGAPPAP